MNKEGLQFFLYWYHFYKTYYEVMGFCCKKRSGSSLFISLYFFVGQARAQRIARDLDASTKRLD